MENETTTSWSITKRTRLSVRNPKVENLVAMPEQTFQLVGAKRGMPPVLTEEGKLGAGDAFDFRRQLGELTFETAAAPIGHKSFTAASIVLKSLGSMAPSARSLASARSFAVGWRAGT